MTTPLIVSPDLAGGDWQDYLAAARDVGRLVDGTIDRIGIYPAGTVSGKATVMIGVMTSDGQVVIGETTLALFATAARALLAAPIAQAEGHGRP
jgi:hypothetical protein